MDDPNAPATKADLEALEERMNERHEMLRTEVQHGFDDLKEAFRDGQTELLKAFYSFAQTTQKRLTEVEREAAGLKERLAIVEERLTDVERKLNTPPAA